MNFPRRLLSQWPSYTFALGAFTCMLLLTVALRSTPVDGGQTFLLLLAIIASARFGGFGPALLATSLSAASAVYFLYPPVNSFHVKDPSDVFELTVFFSVALLVGWQIGTLRPLTFMARLTADIAAKRDFSRRLRLEQHGDPVGDLALHVDNLLASAEEVLRSHRELLADTSHELRNPLLAIRMNLDLLEQMSDGPGKEECLREARQQIERMVRLISDLRLLTVHGESVLANPRPVELAPVIRRAVARASEYAGSRRLLIQEPLSNERVFGDEMRLDQIAANLLDNAIKHTPPHSTVTVGLESTRDKLRLLVRDDGEGIPAEHLARLFERGYRAPANGSSEKEGWGLGLAIVERLAEAHGGHVQVSSEDGKGSSFVVSLPVLQAGKVEALPVR